MHGLSYPVLFENKGQKDLLHLRAPFPAQKVQEKGRYHTNPNHQSNADTCRLSNADVFEHIREPVVR